MSRNNGRIYAAQEGSPARPLSFYEFFAGAGLVRLSLESEWRCAWANDISRRKADVYAANFGCGELEVKDVGQVRAEALPAPVDLAWASFPCQDLSLAGWQRGMSAQRSGTFWAFWRIMRDLFDAGRRPPIIAIENVAGLLYGGNFAGLCEALAAIGMQFGALLIDARYFLPQSRPRVFVIAVDSRVECDAWTLAEPGGSPWVPRAVRAAYTSIPEGLAALWRWWSLPPPGLKPPAVDSLIDDEPEGVGWHSPAETRRLLGEMMTDRNRAKVREALESGQRSVGLLYRRTRDGRQRAEVRFDGFAGCLRTPQGGSSRQTVLIINHGEARTRLLSPREAARLMGAPDSFRLPASYNDGYRAMGDAVAVPVVRWLADHLLTPIARLCRSEPQTLKTEYSSVVQQSLSGSRQAAEALASQWEAFGR